VRNPKLDNALFTSLPLRRQLVGAHNQPTPMKHKLFAGEYTTRANFDQAKTMSGECTEAR